MTAPLARPTAVDDSPSDAHAAGRGRDEGTTHHRRAYARSRGAGTVAAEPDIGECDIVGTEGDDVIRGTPETEIICVLGGDDLIFTYGGDDRVWAADGDDTLRGFGYKPETRGSRLIGGPGDDVLMDGLTGADRLSGGPDDDVLLGGEPGLREKPPNDDLLVGGPGSDGLLAQDGSAEPLNGGPGRDRGRWDRGLDRLRSVERHD